MTITSCNLFLFEIRFVIDINLTIVKNTIRMIKFITYFGLNEQRTLRHSCHEKKKNTKRNSHLIMFKIIQT